MRGIVSMVGSPFEKVSKTLIPILRTIQGRSGLYVKNSRELKEKIKDWRVERNEILVSYDVKNLYPSIPIDKALELVERLLNENEDLGETTTMSVTSIMELLKWMFDLTYCEYGGSHFVLDSGPIGLGATGEIAIIYMEDFQLRAMETSPYPLNEWFWYVDDSETKCKEGEAQEILDHLNTIEPGVIVFTREDQEGDVLPVLDLKQTVDRKTKKIECSVYYKKTHTNINVKERSNHPESMKRAIVKGFTERARALCDEKHLAEELNNIEDVFVANGYSRETVRRFMEQRHQQTDKKEQEEQESRGAVTIPYLKGLSERFRRTANRHSFRVAFKPGRKIKEIKRTCQEPLGERQKCVVYKIPCTCQNSVYVGETWRLFQTRKKEHIDKVRLTNEDLQKGNTLSAERRMGKEDGGLARHTIECQRSIDWTNAKIVATERGLRQRKVLEGIESLRQKHRGMKVLNSFDHVETWKSILNCFFDREGDCNSQ